MDNFWLSIFVYPPPTPPLVRFVETAEYSPVSIPALRKRTTATPARSGARSNRRPSRDLRMVRGAPQRTSGKTETGCTKKTVMTGGTMVMTVASVLVAVVMCTAATSVSAITTKPTGTAFIKTTLQIVPPAGGGNADTRHVQQQQQQQQLPSFAARYWVSTINIQCLNNGRPVRICVVGQ